ncbi:MAG: hypothetical protein J0L53_12730 [Spirochaetes bacterium]|nr:hypothetical protein [Spirochaetota bacterium]
MKKIKLLAIFVAATALSAPAFSIAQIGVQGNYVSDSFSGGTKPSGFGVGGFARFTVGIPMLVTFGFGPYVDYASISVSGGNAVTQFRVGGELVAYADIIGNLIGLTPYGRFGWGYSGNSQSVTIASVTANTLYYGTGGHTLFGLSYKVIPMVYLFAEAGAQWSSLTASVPDSLKAYSSSFSDQTTSGWRVSLGAMLWL